MGQKVDLCPEDTSAVSVWSRGWETFSLHPSVCPRKLASVHTASHSAFLVCTAAFKNKSELNKHLITHDGQGPHKCEHCNKGFITNQVRVQYNKGFITNQVRVQCGDGRSLLIMPVNGALSEPPYKGT